jgi:hypothetical protein
MSLLISGDLRLAKTSVAATDTNIREVSLLLHGDGTNGSTVITDSSGSPKTVTAVGNAQISTAQSKFGGSSLFFNNDSANAITTPSSAAFAFDTNDFTVEAWIYQLAQSTFASLLEIGNHALSDSVLFLTGTSGFQIYSGAFFGSNVNVLSLNTWQHVAYSRSGTTLRMFLNGNLTSSATFANNLTNTSNVSVGFPKGYVPTGGNAVYPFNGYIDDLRITKGVARYAANFTPPAAQFPDI